MTYTLIADDGTEYGPYTVQVLESFALERRVVQLSRLRREDGVIMTAGTVLKYWQQNVPSQRHSCSVDEGELAYAPLMLRIQASFLDIIILWILHIIITSQFQSPQYNVNPVAMLAFLNVTLIIINSVILCLFYTFAQASPGKLLTGLRIVSLDGSKPTAWQVLKRLVATQMSFGLVQIFTTGRGPEHRHMGEKWAGTYTVLIR